MSHVRSFPVLTISLGILLPTASLAQQPRRKPVTPLEQAAAAVGEVTGHQRAMEDVEKEAKTLKAPTGLLGTKWLMRPADVRKIRPNVEAPEKETIPVLSEVVNIYRRDALVSYHFQDDVLLLITVLFKGSSDWKKYMATQELLDQEYGKPPSMTLGKEVQMQTEQVLGRFLIRHQLVKEPRHLDIPFERIIFFRAPQETSTTPQR